MPPTLLSRILAAALVLAAAPVAAGIVNGDFAAGGAGWTAWSTDPSLVAQFQTYGGNPDDCAVLVADISNPGGRACIAQSFTCGVPGGDTVCTVSLDVRFNILGADLRSSRLIVSIDGSEELVVDPTDAWTDLSVDVPCGQHDLEICLEVDPDDNGWVAKVDNVSSQCVGVIGNETRGWGPLKQRYR